jgi:hypothetical protein
MMPYFWMQNDRSCFNSPSSCLSNSLSNVTKYLFKISFHVRDLHFSLYEYGKTSEHIYFLFF